MADELLPEDYFVAGEGQDLVQQQPNAKVL
jgi:hypothetical protein